MKRINSIVAGIGEVGNALLRVIKEHYEAEGVDKDADGIPDECDYLNICIPYNDEFVSVVNNYVDKFQPILTIVHSTVPVGTTKQITGIAVHSPVRGKHPDLEGGLRDYIKYFGYNDDEGNDYCCEYFRPLFRYEGIKNSDTTEFMKLASLAKYLGYLALADEINDVCEKLGVDYKWVKSWERSQNDRIDKYYPDMKWPVLDPPKGKVGGHCCLPVAKIFLEEVKNAGVDTKVVLEAFQKYHPVALHEHI